MELSLTVELVNNEIEFSFLVDTVTPLVTQLALTITACAPLFIYLITMGLEPIPYSRNISRAPIFEDFEDFLLTSKILSSNFWLLG